MGVLEQRPNGIFPPVNVVRAYYLDRYTPYYHLRLPYPPHGLFAYAYSPTQLNGTPGLTERLREIEPYLFPYIIQSPQLYLWNLKLLRYVCKMYFVSYYV